MDASQIKSNPQFNRAREAFITHYMTAVNEAMAAENLGLKAIDPQDFAILTRQEMREFSQQVNGTVHPEMEKAFNDVLGQKITFDFIQSTADAVTVPAERNVILLDASNQGVQLSNSGTIHLSTLPFITGMCHEAVHYSTQTRYFGNDSPLTDLVKRTNFPVVIRGPKLAEGKQRELEERVNDIIRNTELEIRVNGALMYVRAKHSDGKLYAFGMVGYNFEEALAEWFSERLKRKAVNLFLEKNRSLAAGRARDLVIGVEQTSARGSHTYTTQGAKTELQKLGFVDFQSALRAYISGEMPLVFAKKNPRAPYYY